MKSNCIINKISFYFFVLFFILQFNVISSAAEKTEDIIRSIVLSEDESPPEKIGNDAKEKENQKLKKKEVKRAAKAKRDFFEEEKTSSAQDELMLKTAILLYESGLYDSAMRKFNELKDKYPQSPYLDNARIWSAKIRIKLGKFDDALKELQSINEDSGEYPSSLYYRGRAQLGSGNSVNAIEDFYHLSAQFPEYELADNALLEIAKIYMSEKRGEQSLEAAFKIIKRYPDRETVDDAFFLVGEIYGSDPVLKDIEISRKVYRLFLKRAGENEEPFKSSPLKKRVKKELDYIETTFFKLEN